MSSPAAFSYAQARMQAQHGQRPDDGQWNMLRASKSLGHYLESARQTGLAPWVSHLSVSSDVHAIEATLRGDWRAFSERVAFWLPAPWRASVKWTGRLPELAFPDEDGTEPAPGTTARPLAAWLERFERLLPPMDAHDRRWMAHLRALIARHLGHGADARQSKGGDDGERARATLAGKLERMLHQAAQRPPAVFAFLGLMALDLERLRADLVRRRLFEDSFDPQSTGTEG